MTRSVRRSGFIAGVVVIVAALALATPHSVASASASRPSPPRLVRALAQAKVAHVTWAAPTSVGSSKVTRYVVTSHPLAKTCATGATSCVVTGLHPGSRYTFTVVAHNAAGASAPSRSSNRIRLAPEVVSVKEAGANFLAAANALDSSVAADEAALEVATTPSDLTTALTNLGNDFATYTKTLGHDTWPTNTRADMLTYISDVNTVAAATIAGYAATAANASTLLATIQGDANVQAQADAKIRSDLRLPALITGPVATTSSPGALGAALVVHDYFGDALTVTLSRIDDPATAGAGSGLADPGYRFVAVELTLADPTSGEVDGDANYSAAVLGSDGVTYGADFGTVAECTNFVYGAFEVPTGDTSSGCVVFQLPTGVTVASVTFTMDAGYLDTATWTP